MVEGLEYARLGQTKKLTIGPSRADASVQGRGDRPYVTSLAFTPLNNEAWEKVVHAMAEGAIYAAKLLAGELPTNIEEVFAPLALKLFPTESTEITVSCSCSDFHASKALNSPGAETPPSPSLASTTTPWCKHICCIAYLLGQRFAQEPYLMFLLRGMEGKDLLERLRERRVVAGAGTTAVAVYTQHVPGVSDAILKPLDECLENFWDAGPGLSTLDLPLSPPPVSHPLLRRLGPSPFQNAPFPLVGLLASCYEVISEDARKAAADEGAELHSQSTDSLDELHDDHLGDDLSSEEDHT